MSKITLKDLADQLNVSTATISMALNQKPGISDKMRNRVLKAASEAGYHTVKLSSEIKRQFGNVGLVIGGGYGKHLMENPFFSLIINSIEKTAYNNGYNFSVIYLNTTADFEQLEKQYDGIILLATGMTQEELEPFLTKNIPLVALDNSFSFTKIDTVAIDNIGGIISAIEYLVSCGHQRIGYLKGTTYVNNFVERFKGFQLAMERAGLEIFQEDIIDAGNTVEHVNDTLTEFLNVRGTKVTAFIADNDNIAFGAQLALRKKEFRIGKDIALVGFDDLPYSRISDPPLTTVRVFNEELGKVAMERLAEIIDYKSICRHITIATELMIRDSVNLL